MIRLLIRSGLLWMLATHAALAADEPAKAWDYSAGIVGDEGWGVLSPEFAACEIGTSQSPINISDAQTADLPALHFDYRSASARMEMSDHTLVITLDKTNTLTIDGQAYQLTQIRFHSPSEHQIEGRNYPLEIHLIHRDSKQGLLIVAIVAQFGEDNPAIAAMLQHIEAHSAAIALDPAPFVPDAVGYFSYSGSLSWPPCTQGVEWRVLKHPTHISIQQYRKLARMLERNARQIQPVNARTVLQSMD